MFESVIMLLIQVCLVVALCYIVIWVLGQLGIGLPPQVIKILWVVVVLIVILLLFRALSPFIHGGRILGVLNLPKLA